MLIVLPTTADYFNSIKVRLKLPFLWSLASLSLNFNSIKVRLKLTCKHIQIFVFVFQFHKGTIKTPQRGTSLLRLPYFNSIKVRLKPYQSAPVLPLKVFQFHKGTIKTDLERRQIGHVPQFQFHKGTIKT